MFTSSQEEEKEEHASKIEEEYAGWVDACTIGQRELGDELQKAGLTDQLSQTRSH